MLAKVNVKGRVFAFDYEDFKRCETRQITSFW